MNHYSILEVSPKATAEVIKAAYLALAKQHHTNDARMKQLNLAWEVLGDEDRRLTYDKGERKQVKGKTVGQWRILSQIAEGGFGITYKGEHVLTKTPVCIKHATGISLQDEELLLGEARTMWDLRHHGIPAIRDVVKMEDGSVALVMSYIPGPTLAQVVEKRGPLDPEHVCWIVDRCLNILQYLAEHTVVHGDVKPQNIIIPPDENNPRIASHQVCLVDYGLSLVKPKRTTGNKGYTPHFAAPEQLQGDKPLLPGTDMYGLGMTMIFALGGNVGNKQVPGSVPDPLCLWMKRLIAHDVLRRPVFPVDPWNHVVPEEDLRETLSEVRANCFGRHSSGLKALEVA